MLIPLTAPANAMNLRIYSNISHIHFCFQFLAPVAVVYIIHNRSIRCIIPLRLWLCRDSTEPDIYGDTEYGSNLYPMKPITRQNHKLYVQTRQKIQEKQNIYEVCKFRHECGVCGRRFGIGLLSDCQNTAREEIHSSPDRPSSHQSR